MGADDRMDFDILQRVIILFLFNLLSQNFSSGQSTIIQRYYVDAIASALKAYDNSKFDVSYYKALAWDGLEKTDSYKIDLTSTEKTDITTKRNALLLNRSKINCDDI